jgi:putrescine aminotransferase
MVKGKSKREKFPTTMRTGLFFRDAAFRNGLVLRAVGDTVVASPPLVITHAEVDELIEKLGRTLDETDHYVRSL